MNAVVLDTDVWSFLFKRDTRAELYRRHLENNALYLSFQTVAELYQWAEMSHWGERRRERLQKWLHRFVMLGCDDATTQIWARIRAERNQQGRPIASQDAWVAACALRHSYPLITHNANDYKNITGLTTISEKS
jgi:predicted nucleic acid-binding protein